MDASIFKGAILARIRPACNLFRNFIIFFLIYKFTLACVSVIYFSQNEKFQIRSELAPYNENLDFITYEPGVNNPTFLRQRFPIRVVISTGVSRFYRTVMNVTSQD